MQRLLPILVIFLMTLSSGAFGADLLTLDECISIATANNPVLKSYRQQYKAALAQVRRAGALPQPEINLDYDLQPRLFDFNGSDESYIGISQLLEFPGRVATRKKIARKESDLLMCDMEGARLELIYQVKKSFYSLLLAKEIEKYALDNLSLARDFLTKAREKYNSGDVSRLEVLKARVEAARAENKRKVAATTVKLAKSQLNFVMARDRVQPIQISGTLKPGSLNWNLEHLIALSLEQRPEIKKMKIDLEKEKLGKRQAGMNFLPDLSLGVSKHRIGGEPESWDVSLSFAVPLFFWQQKPELDIARANIESVKSQLTYSELSISLEVETLYHNALSYGNQIEFFESEVLNEAEQVYEMSLASYLEGKIGSIELIESRKTLLELKQAYAENLFNYQLALAELERCIGTRIQGEKNAR